VRERGQVFTLDMLLALILVAAVLGASGEAFALVSRQMRDYSSRYSLERVANDAADVLVRTSGYPENWETDVGSLEVLGLAEEEGGKPVPNTLSVVKLGWLRELCRHGNWDAPEYENVVRVIKALFGGSEKFEVNVYGEDGDLLWGVWPRWDVEASSGSENSTDVVVARRLIVKRQSGSTRSEAKGLQHLVAGLGKEYFLDFWVYPGELEAFDWYIVLRPSGKTNPTTRIWVNRSTGNHDFKFPPEGNTVFTVRHHGEDGDVRNPLTDAENNGQPNNYLKVKVTGDPSEWVDVFLVLLPKCSPAGFAPDAPDVAPAVLEVKMWR